MTTITPGRLGDRRRSAGDLAVRHPRRGRRPVPSGPGLRDERPLRGPAGDHLAVPDGLRGLDELAVPRHLPARPDVDGPDRRPRPAAATSRAASRPPTRRCRSTARSPASGPCRRRSSSTRGATTAGWYPTSTGITYRTPTRPLPGHGPDADLLPIRPGPGRHAAVAVRAVSCSGSTEPSAIASRRRRRRRNFSLSSSPPSSGCRATCRRSGGGPRRRGRSGSRRRPGRSGPRTRGGCRAIVGGRGPGRRRRPGRRGRAAPGRRPAARRGRGQDRTGRARPATLGRRPGRRRGRRRRVGPGSGGRGPGPAGPDRASSGRARRRSAIVRTMPATWRRSGPVGIAAATRSSRAARSTRSAGCGPLQLLAGLAVGVGGVAGRGQGQDPEAAGPVAAVGVDDSAATRRSRPPGPPPGSPRPGVRSSSAPARSIALRASGLGRLVEEGGRRRPRPPSAAIAGVVRRAGLDRAASDGAAPARRRSPGGRRSSGDDPAGRPTRASRASSARPAAAASRPRVQRASPAVGSSGKASTWAFRAGFVGRPCPGIAAGREASRPRARACKRLALAR